MRRQIGHHALAALLESDPMPSSWAGWPAKGLFFLATLGRSGQNYGWLQVGFEKPERAEVSMTATRVLPPRGILSAVALLLALSACTNQRKLNEADSDFLAMTGGGAIPYLIVTMFPRYGSIKSESVDPSTWPKMCGEARSGDGQARATIGWYYRNGWAPASANPVEAYKWFTLAANAGNADAEQYRATLASGMQPDQLAEAERRAAVWTAETEDCVAVPTPSAVVPAS